MMMNKRSFLVGAAGAVIASQAPALALNRAAPEQARPSSPTTALGEAPGLREWQAYAQQRFALVGGGSLLLGRIEQQNTCRSSGTACEQFVLGFVNPGNRPVAAGIHTLRHANGQQASVYLEPAAHGGQQTLQAVFNLMPRGA